MSRTDAEVTRAAERTARTVLRLLSERNTAEAERDMALEMHRVQYERANRVTDERDRARDLAAALEAQLAAVEALADRCVRAAAKDEATITEGGLTLGAIDGLERRAVNYRMVAEAIRAVLNPVQP